MAKSESDKQGADSPSRLIDQRIEELGDWRGEMLARRCQQWLDGAWERLDQAVAARRTDDPSDG